jgi:hypothetical protein
MLQAVTMEWKEILKSINQDFFQDRTNEELLEGVEYGWIDPHVYDSKWLGFPPASPESIFAREDLLGMKLPPSYKDFFLHSNGFRDISPFLNNLFPVEEINWAVNFETERKLTIWQTLGIEVSDEKYNIYGPDQDPVWYRPEYIKDSLKICEWCDGMCVYLNPLINFDREWEVIVYANWYPGARRYKSFKEYMICVHENNVQLLQNKNNYR